MAITDGKTSSDLIDRLAADPYAFDFFRAVRLIESAFPGQPRIGHSNSPARDPIRFAQSASLGFAPSTIEAVQPGDPPRFLVRFFGLLGPQSPMPLFLTEYALERERHHGDRTLTAFLNIFHHRLLSFFYRAWSDNQKAVDLDRDSGERFGVFIGSLLGCGQPEMGGRDSIQDWARLFFTGHLSRQTRNAEGLQSILEAYFDVPAKVVEFRGKWLDLPEESRCRLGHSPDTGTLGQSILAGDRFWNCQLTFRIQMGPMSLQDCERLLPGGRSFRRLKQWVHFYCGEEFFWDLQLVLKANEVPDTRLGGVSRLGWTTWLKTRPFERDSHDLVVWPPAYPDEEKLEPGTTH